MKTNESILKNLREEYELGEYPTFTCPSCGKKLDDIGVCVRAQIHFDTLNAEYSSVEEIEGTDSYYCPECGNDLPFEETDKFIEEVGEQAWR